MADEVSQHSQYLDTHRWDQFIADFGSSPSATSSTQSSKRGRGRPRTDGVKPGWMYLRACLIVEAYSAARSAGAKHKAAVDRTVIEVKRRCPEMKISSGEVRRILAEFHSAKTGQVIRRDLDGEAVRTALFTRREWIEDWEPRDPSDPLYPQMKPVRRQVLSFGFTDERPSYSQAPRGRHLPFGKGKHRKTS